MIMMNVFYGVCPSIITLSNFRK